MVLGGETLSEEEIKRRSLRLNGVFVLRSMESSFEEGGLLPHVSPSCPRSWTLVFSSAEDANNLYCRPNQVKMRGG